MTGEEPPIRLCIVKRRFMESFWKTTSFSPVSFSYCSFEYYANSGLRNLHKRLRLPINNVSLPVSVINNVLMSPRQNHVFEALCFGGLILRPREKVIRSKCLKRTTMMDRGLVHTHQKSGRILRIARTRRKRTRHVLVVRRYLRLQGPRDEYAC